MFKKYINSKYHILEILFLTMFLFFSLDFFGIPDKYDFYIYIFLSIIFALNLILYIRLVAKELDELIHKEYEEK